jgi:predicted Rossmann-fold nucleotide-binding protein
MTNIFEIDTLEEYIGQRHDLRDCVVQGLDLAGEREVLKGADVAGAVFLGCTFDHHGLAESLRDRGALVFPEFGELPYNPYRPTLYTREELVAGWDGGDGPDHSSHDFQIYAHFEKKGRHQPDILEAVSQRIHDHAIDDALGDLLSGKHNGGERKKVVGIMGGHGTPRTDPFFAKVAEVARGLAREGYFVASGGGPGMMEATNLGAYLAPFDDSALDESLNILSRAPVFTDSGYMATAAEVVERFPDGGESLAIPTWFYGHEPSNMFSGHIAKYFSNSLREDGLLALATHGVIYSPGSAGTTQEVFMDATQNHYGTFDVISPMVFLGEKRYTEDTGIYPLIERLAEGRQYGEMLMLSDKPEDIVCFIKGHPPVPAKK